MAIIDGAYVPNDKTKLEFEFAGSKNDLNLFSEKFAKSPPKGPPIAHPNPPNNHLFI